MFLRLFRFFNFSRYLLFRFLKYMALWTQKYYQGVHKDYPIHYYDERYEITSTPINSNRYTDFDF